MEEILNNHLGCVNPVQNGINYQPQLVSQISSIKTTYSPIYFLTAQLEARCRPDPIGDVSSNPIEIDEQSL